MELKKTISKKKPTVLIILDGFGISKRVKGNAVANAHTPNFDKYRSDYPYTILKACGVRVGLPKGQMGNSEVGHQNIGAGRIVPQELWRIDADIKKHNFLNNIQFHNAIANCKAKKSNLHIMLLASHGGVHSEINHLYELLKLFAEHNINVYIHCFMDGRDTEKTEGINVICELEQKIRETGCGRIATVQGRYYAMDRDDNFGRLQAGYNAIVRLQGHHYKTAAEAVSQSYKALEAKDSEKVSDEYIEPCIIDGAEGISDNDAVVFCNFRPDRAKSIMKMLIYKPSELSEWYTKANDAKKKKAEKDKKSYSDMPKPDTEGRPEGLYIVAMSDYDDSIDSRMHIAYNKPIISMTLGEYISNLGFKQLRIAETEKYAHVTRFFSGNREKKFKGERRILVPSPNVDTYDEQPEMSAYPVCDKCIRAIKRGTYDFIVINFANPDMVGHTGNYKAAVAAIEAVDRCLGKLIDAVQKAGGKAIITADHGNADEMIDKKGKVSTQHSLNPVPFIIVGKDYYQSGVTLRRGGALCDIAPTVLDIMGLDKPKEFMGKSLIEK